jgi:hypothetical protein
MTMTPEDFVATFATETEFLEFKQGLPENRVQEAVVAFSNTSGGVVILGVAPDGRPRGLRVDGELIARELPAPTGSAGRRGTGGGPARGRVGTGCPGWR